MVREVQSVFFGEHLCANQTMMGLCFFFLKKSLFTYNSTQDALKARRSKESGLDASWSFFTLQGHDIITWVPPPLSKGLPCPRRNPRSNRNFFFAPSRTLYTGVAEATVKLGEYCGMHILASSVGKVVPAVAVVVI